MMTITVAAITSEPTTDIRIYITGFRPNSGDEKEDN